METRTKVMLGIAGAVGLGTAVVLWPKKAKASPGGPGGTPGGPGTKPVTTDSGAELIQACSDGTKEGAAEGAKDGASTSVEFESPLPRLGYSVKLITQAKYEECYQKAYSTAFKIAKATKKLSTYSVDDGTGTTTSTPPGADAGKKAEDAGYTGGFAQGVEDATNKQPFIIGDTSRVPPGYRSMPSEGSGLQAFWVGGYTSGYSNGFSSVPVTTPTKKVEMKEVEPLDDAYGGSWTTTEDDGEVLGEFVRVGGRIVPRTRVGAMYMSKTTPARRGKFSGGKWYDVGFAAGISDCKKWIAMGQPKITPPGFGSHGDRPFNDKASDTAWYEGFSAGWDRCRSELLKPGKPMVIEVRNVQPTGFLKMAKIAGETTVGAIAIPVFRTVTLPVANIYDRARATYRHMATRGLVSGALSSRAYYK